MSAVSEQRQDRSAPEAEFAALFAAARAELPGPAWIQSLRAEGLSAFMREGLPHKRLERWKYTDFRARFGGGLDVARGTSADAPVDLFDGLKAHRVLIDAGKVRRSSMRLVAGHDTPGLVFVRAAVVLCDGRHGNAG